MARFKVVVTDYVFESFDTERKVLAGVDAALEVCQCKSAAELFTHLAGTHVLLNTYMPGIGKEVFDQAPDLKAVVRYGIGLDTIDLAEATLHGVMVANVPDYCLEEVADHAMALFLCLARKIAFADQKVKAGEWSLSYLKPLPGITGMTVGIIGFGRIGRALAHRVKAFGPEVVFHDPYLEGEVDGCRRVDLDYLYAHCHVIFVQCPANEKTRHLLDLTAFSKMAQKPFVINAARGAIVDTDALVMALERGMISGAGLDVVEDEKTVQQPGHPLKRFPNVVLTPHSAWYSTAAIQKLQRKAVEEAARVLRGEKPLSLVNPEVLGTKPCVR